MKENTDLPDYEIKKTTIFSEDPQATVAIGFSPFYKNKAHTLPDKTTTVEPGGFYIRDDGGGLITQLVNATDSNKSLVPKGSIDLEGKVATVARDSIITATSFKGSPITSDHVGLSNGFTIINLTKVTSERPPLLKPNKDKALKVEDPQNGPFYVYNVYSQNGQLTVIHTIKPTPVYAKPPNETGTQTAVHGMVYVEFGNNTYIGYLGNTFVFFEDPSGAFRDDIEMP
jgi:hypothetical protein